jgi:hypothetical protein
VFAALSGNNNRVALILNAGDFWGNRLMLIALLNRQKMFAGIGMEVTDIDLRAYTGRHDELERRCGTAAASG